MKADLLLRDQDVLAGNQLGGAIDLRNLKPNPFPGQVNRAHGLMVNKSTWIWNKRLDKEAALR